VHLKRRGQATITLSIIGAGLLVAACGSSQSSTAGSSTATTPSTSATASGAGASATSRATDAAAAPAGTPIKIGLAVAETGPLSSSVPASAPAATAWQDSVNAAGGIGGHPVQVIVGDTEGSPVEGSTVIKQLVGQDKVVAVLVEDSLNEQSIGGYLTSQNVPLIGAGGFVSPVWTKEPDHYELATDGNDVVGSEGVAAVADGGKNVGVVACAEICTSNGATVQAQVVRLGDKYVGQVVVTAGAAGYTATCVAMIQRNASALVVNTDPQTSVRVMQSCLQQGYKGVFVTSATSFLPAVFGKVAGVKMAGSLNGFPWWANAPGAAAYRDAMQKYEPSVSVASTSGTAVWSALELFQKVAAGISGAITPASVIAGYDTVKNETLGGLLPQPVTFTAGQPSAVVNCFWQFKFNAGDANPKVIPPTGASGNGATGDLATACLK
jgi:branched-chain amino acid transport system substrate-binding protein